MCLILIHIYIYKIFKFLDYVPLKNDFKIYGLTQSTISSEYMVVFESNYKRSIRYGTCANCNRDNTSSAWCQTCDPYKTAQGWTSGNKNIDDCIKEFQLKATKYDDV